MQPRRTAAPRSQPSPSGGARRRHRHSRRGNTWPTSGPLPSPESTHPARDPRPQQKREPSGSPLKLPTGRSTSRAVVPTAPPAIAIASKETGALSKSEESKPPPPVRATVSGALDRERRRTEDAHATPRADSRSPHSARARSWSERLQALRCGEPEAPARRLVPSRAAQVFGAMRLLLTCPGPRVKASGL